MALRNLSGVMPTSAAASLESQLPLAFCFLMISFIFSGAGTDAEGLGPSSMLLGAPDSDSSS